MANISITYTFSNGTTADATQVNQNFSDIISGTSDGTKDMSISALTAAGNVSFTGSSITLGNATGDDLTITASLASTINIKTTNTYNIGSSTLGLASIYLGANSQTVRIMASGSTSETWTLTLPVSNGDASQILQTDGSGVTSWQTRLATPTVSGFITTFVPTVASATVTKTNTDYTILDNDGYDLILVSAGAAQRTMTLPTAADNTGRIITIKKTDAGAGTVVIDGEGSETIDGTALTNTISSQYAYITLQCNGTMWVTIAVHDYLEVKGNGTSDTSATDLGTLSITPGVWSVSANVSANLATGITFVTANIVTATGTEGTNGDNRSNGAANLSAGSGNAVVPDFRVVLTAATTYYITSKSSLSNTVGFRLSAWRVG